jgi:hypothetical protein
MRVSCSATQLFSQVGAILNSPLQSVEVPIFLLHLLNPFKLQFKCLQWFLDDFISFHHFCILAQVIPMLLHSYKGCLRVGGSERRYLELERVRRYLLQDHFF